MNYLAKAKEIAAIRNQIDLANMEKSQAGQKAYFAMINELGGALKDFADQIRREYDEEKRGRG